MLLAALPTERRAFGVTKVPQEQVDACWGTVSLLLWARGGGGADAAALDDAACAPCAFLGKVRLAEGAAGAAAAGAIASANNCIWEAMAAIVASREAMRAPEMLESIGSGGVSSAAKCAVCVRIAAWSTARRVSSIDAISSCCSLCCWSSCCCRRWISSSCCCCLRRASRSSLATLAASLAMAASDFAAVTAC